MNKDKYIIDKETAEDEFDRFCDAWNLDYDISEMDEDDAKGFNTQKKQIIKAIRQGFLCLNDDNLTLTYKFSEYSAKIKNEEVTIKLPEGNSYMDMDGWKTGQLIRKLYAVLGSMTGKPVRFFSNVNGVDLKPLQAIVTLFLAE